MTDGAQEIKNGCCSKSMVSIYMKHILLTGPPGIGKTTVIRKLAEKLKEFHPVGFYTQEIREHGVRKGFQLVTLDARRQTLSHVDHQGPFRVGQYGVDVAGFERLLTDLDLSRSASRVIIIDEIGKMECASDCFIEEMKKLLNSSKILVGTVALKGGAFIAAVKNRPDCKVESVTIGNRATLADTLLPEIFDVLKCPRDLS